MTGWRLNLEELVAATEGDVIAQHERTFAGIGTNTREDLTGKIFVALKGDVHDAHRFLEKAVQAGASALLVHEMPSPSSDLPERVTIVHVRDTLPALQLLGNFWRHKMRAQILGVTGTNGKTTTKEFAAALIGTQKRVQWSKGSFNNHWGVPISLLTIDPSHEVALIEMGMNHPGELKVLSEIAEADAVVVTMVGRGHLEGVGSIEGAAKAKSEIYEYAPKKALRIFNLENDHTRAMHERFARDLPASQVLTFAGLEWARAHGHVAPAAPVIARPPATTASTGAWPSLDVAFEIVSAGPDSLHLRGEIQGVGGETTVPVFGRHNITNLMTAACFALAAGLTPAQIWAGLPECRTVWGRNQWVKLESGARALFDAYNANPESMRAAIENFAALAGRKFALLGEMRELGAHAGELHRELGHVVARAGFEGIAFVGPSRASFEAGLREAGFEKSAVMSDAYELNLAPRSWPVLRPDDLVLIKGSRGMQLEKALADLKPLDFKAK